MSRELRVRKTVIIRPLSVSINARNPIQQYNGHKTVYDDGIKIIGGEIGSGTVNSNHDHRIAMAFIILSLVAFKEFDIDNTDCIDISLPGFFDILKEIQR